MTRGRWAGAALGVWSALIAGAGAGNVETLRFARVEFGVSHGYAIATDATAAYVAGSVRNAAWGASLKKIGLDSGGAVVWTASAGGAGAPDVEDAARAVALHPSGDVVVGGRLWDGAGNLFDAWLARFTSDGVPVWSLTRDGGLGTTDMIDAVACTLTPTGDIWVAGRRDAGNGTLALWVARFDGGGGFRGEYTSPYSPIQNDGALAIAVDASGSAYVAGYVAVPGHSQDIWISKHGRNASPPLWTVTIDGALSGTDYAAGIALEPDGSLIVTGAQTIAGDNLDIWIARVANDGRGTVLWSLTLDGGEGDEDAAAGCAVDPASGDVFVAGRIDLPSLVFGDAWLANLSSAGAFRWMIERDGAGHYEDAAAGVALVPGRPAVAVAGSLFGTDNKYHMFTALYEDTVTAFAESVRTGVWAGPTPFRPGSGGAFDDAAGIHLHGVPAGATARFYGVAGALVAEVAEAGGEAVWDGRNQDSGKPAASGVYVYVVVPRFGPVVRGKVMIIR